MPSCPSSCRCVGVNPVLPSFLPLFSFLLFRKIFENFPIQWNGPRKKKKRPLLDVHCPVKDGTVSPSLSDLTSPLSCLPPTPTLHLSLSVCALIGLVGSHLCFPQALSIKVQQIIDPIMRISLAVGRCFEPLILKMGVVGHDRVALTPSVLTKKRQGLPFPPTTYQVFALNY